jgi:ligand-binding sensor domain-containing protein
MLKLILLPLAFFSGSFFLFAQQQAWSVFNDSNSMLPQNTVRCIAVDADNKKWIGTDFGLATFDEINWMVYNTSNSGLPDNNVRAIGIDKQGNKWIGTLSGGVAKFDGTTWTVYNSSNSGLPGNFVRAVAFDTAGVKWFGTSSGLVRFDDVNWQVWTNTNSPLISHHVASLAIGKDNMKYFGTINGGLVYFDDTTMTFYNLWNGTLPDNTVLAIALDTAGYRWMGMPSGGTMVHYGGSVWQWFSTTNSSIQSNAINAVYVDSMPEAYIGSQEKGLIIKSGFTFTNYDSANSPMPDVNVTAIARDKNRILWLGTMYGGLVRLDESALNSIDDVAGEKVFHLYPNILRSGEIIYMENVKDAMISVYDGSGRKCLQAESSGDMFSMRIDLGSGMYHIAVKKEAKIWRSKMIVIE